jgi:uroporphyrinogen-III synthase
MKKREPSAADPQNAAATSPLLGKVIVNTRAEHQAQELTDLLEAKGAVVLPYPTIEIVPVQDTAPLDQALTQAVEGAFDWLVLTSANTVDILRQRLVALGAEGTALGVACQQGLKVAAVGKATKKAAEDALGVQINLIPKEFVAESLADELQIRRGQRVFLPQSAIARPVLAQALRQKGADVTAVHAYHTGIGRGGVALPVLLWEGKVDAVVFTSASTVHNFMRRLQREQGNWSMLIDVCVACIGPIAAAAAEEHGLRVRVLPEEHTLEALVDGLEQYFAPSARPVR